MLVRIVRTNYPRSPFLGIDRFRGYPEFYGSFYQTIKSHTMIREAVLLRTADKVLSYIQKYAKRTGAESREEAQELFDNLYHFFPHWVIMTCPLMHPDITYISKNVKQVLGYEPEFLMNNARIEKFFSLVHSDDQLDLKECFDFVHDHMQTVDPDEHKNIRTIFHYRFRKPDGLYLYVFDEKATLYLSGGNLYYALLRDISFEKTFSGVKVEIFRQGQTLEKIEEFKPSAHRLTLSKREKELVTLIKQGLSTKEIAWQLNISHNTVRNIKSKMFEKFNVSNSIELLNIAG